MDYPTKSQPISVASNYIARTSLVASRGLRQRVFCQGESEFSRGILQITRFHGLSQQIVALRIRLRRYSFRTVQA